MNIKPLIFFEEGERRENKDGLGKNEIKGDFLFEKPAFCGKTGDKLRKKMKISLLLF